MAADVTRRIALEWMDAFNAKDLNRLVGLYAEDATHFSPKLKAAQPETNGLITGHAALGDWWQGAYNRLPTLFYKMQTITADADRVFIEYIREVEGEEDMAVAEAYDIKDGKIVFSRVYHG
ncbi:nuclear transport factor 2 family protein [Flavobacterium sp. RHBU_24]|uniref:nuclear transport factor 2 family protein n=1 Tax=Flavobacterium sp. RHBU_24 TaxID=3391185 RepID=UPI0039851A07